MAELIRWGIIGTGTIARKFAEGLAFARGAELRAVGSRTRDTAEAFGERYQIPNRHESYESLAADPEVDVVYIATPHPWHKENSMLCLRAGKAVLCEKPFTVNQEEALELVACARAEKRFLMEAMWTRFLPVIGEVRRLVQSGAIGRPVLMRGDFGFYGDYEEDKSAFLPELAGGALLDVGIYPISLASMIFGSSPSDIISAASLGRLGTDELNVVTLVYPQGEMAITSSAIRLETPQDAVITGEKGSIHIHAPFWCAEKITVSLEGKEPEVIEMPLQGNGYNYEAEAVMEALLADELESPLMPLDESIALMGILDKARKQWGLRYPMERGEWNNRV
ncbi:MAG: Gfo/Idh/MocA family oxidoreductase [Candidatus Hydrogenedens sp.]|jgi:predicted dehydrogenase|nr:Gfo/Idh/MocA family oxidoreductase [Candidatus Hydrogenedens sp.]